MLEVIEMPNVITKYRINFLLIVYKITIFRIFMLFDKVGGNIKVSI